MRGVVLKVRTRSGVIYHRCVDLHEADEMCVVYSKRGDTPESIEIDGKVAFAANDIAQMIRELVGC